jgi:putative ABC transport system permease protein
MVMRAFDRKLFRDLARLKVQAAAISLVVASGVSLFVGMLATYRSLRVSEHHYYADRRFAQVWSDLSRAPLSVTRSIAEIPGVVAVEGRIKQQTVLDVPGLDEPASALLVSIPSTSGHALNDLYLRRGRHVEPGHGGEVLVSEAFAEENHLSLGDAITATVAGRRVELRFVGVALSPEYVMPVPPSGLSPDNRRYAVIWMARDELQALVDLRGAFNEVALSLAPGADERPVVTAVDRVLQPYGGRGAYGRDSQPSHTMLEEHIQLLKPLAVLLPTLFLLVAGFLVNIVLSRTIATQREQIGLLKAFGYTSLRVALHYVELTLLLVLPGIVLGIPAGALLGHVVATFFARFFRFPVLIYRVEPAVVIAGSLIACLAAATGTLGSVRRVVAMPPVVAMAPEIPAFHRSLLDVTGLSRLLGPTHRMVLRNVLRSPVRSALAVGGMALAVAIVTLGSAIGDSSDRMRDVRFQLAERQDLTVTLAHPRATGTVGDFLALPGVLRAEPFRGAPARLVARGRVHDVALVGLAPGGWLRHIADNENRVTAIPQGGAVVTRWLAERLGLHKDDRLWLEIRENRRRFVTTPLVGVVDEPLGSAAYMDLAAMGRLLGEPATYSSVGVAIDPTRARDLYAVLKQTPAAMAVDFRRGSLASYRSMSDSVVTFVQRIEVVFAVVIAFGVVYNSAKIALAERARELATLRVLGFTRGEVSTILLGEIGVLAAPAVPLGLAVGYWLSSLLARAMTGERMHMPHVVDVSTYAFAVLVFGCAAVASALLVRRGLDRLDLVGVLKARE